MLSLSGTATLAQYESVLENVTYENTNTDNPNTGNRTVTWVVNDGSANSVGVTSTITVTAQNDPPAIGDATVALDENSANGTAVTNVNDSFTGTDLDRDGQAITYSITAGNTGGAFAIDSATGALTVATSAALDFETTPSFTLTVQASDGTLTDTAALTINLNNLNEAPVAGDDAVITSESTAVTTGNVLANDSDVDSVLSPASISAFDAVSVNGGTVVNNGDGTFTYTPGANFTGIDTFTYTWSRRNNWSHDVCVHCDSILSTARWRWRQHRWRRRQYWRFRRHRFWNWFRIRCRRGLWGWDHWWCRTSSGPAPSSVDQ